MNKKLLAVIGVLLITVTILLVWFLIKSKDDIVNILIDIKNDTEHEISGIEAFVSFKNINDRKTVIERFSILPSDLYLYI